jgi:hypothetical protein
MCRRHQVTVHLACLVTLCMCVYLFVYADSEDPAVSSNAVSASVIHALSAAVSACVQWAAGATRIFTALRALQLPLDTVWLPVYQRNSDTGTVEIMFPSFVAFCCLLFAIVLFSLRFFSFQILFAFSPCCRLFRSSLNALLFRLL